MAAPRSSVDRLAVLTCRLGFWLPLVVCTYLALVPEPPDNPVFRLGDVILHAAAFTYLTFAFLLVDTARFPDSVRQPGIGLDRAIALRALLAMLGYGIFLEVMQSLIPERSAELKDLAVDLLGIALGLLLAALLARSVASLLQVVIRWLTGILVRWS